MALVKTYWDGPQRQRAVSMWSIGSWGGSGLAALFGGAVDAVRRRLARHLHRLDRRLGDRVPARSRDAGEQGRAQRSEAVDSTSSVSACSSSARLSLMIVLALRSASSGWASPACARPGRGGAIAACVAVRAASSGQKLHPFIDFDLFRNTTFTGATISNFLLNGTIGMLIVSQQLIQLAGTKSDGSLLRLGRRAADHRLRDRDHRLHPRRREAAAAVRRPQADDLGLAHRDRRLRAADVARTC